MTKADRKEYNRSIDSEIKDTDKALTAGPLVILIYLLCAFMAVTYIPKPFGGYIALFFVAGSAWTSLTIFILKRNNLND